MTITHELLDEIERGLDGVPPGPWKSFAGCGYGVWAEHGPNATAICLPYGPRRSPQKPIVGAHIARLDPQTVGELVRLARIGLEAGDHDLAAAAYLHGAADLKAAIARAEAAEKRASMLERALAPFATHYQAWMDRYADNITSSTFPIHTFGDLRRARDALRRGLPVDPCEAAQSVLNQAAAAIQAVLDGIERADDEAP